MTTKRRGYLLLLSVMILLAFSACGRSANEETEKYPFTLSASAKIYEFPKDNMIALKSIAIDTGGQHEIRIYEFDRSSAYIPQEGIEEIIQNLKNKPSKIQGIDLQGQFENYSDVKMFSTETSYYILIIVNPEENINELFINYHARDLSLYGIEKPHIVKCLYHCEQNGVKGDLYEKQDYDVENNCWGEINEQFYQDVGSEIIW